jgi:hypothetical protein
MALHTQATAPRLHRFILFAIVCAVLIPLHSVTTLNRSAHATQAIARQASVAILTGPPLKRSASLSDRPIA